MPPSFVGHANGGLTSHAETPCALGFDSSRNPLYQHVPYICGGLPVLCRTGWLFDGQAYRCKDTAIAITPICATGWQAGPLLDFDGNDVLSAPPPQALPRSGGLSYRCGTT